MSKMREALELYVAELKAVMPETDWLAWLSGAATENDLAALRATEKALVATHAPLVDPIALAHRIRLDFDKHQWENPVDYRPGDYSRVEDAIGFAIGWLGREPVAPSPTNAEVGGIVERLLAMAPRPDDGGEQRYNRQLYVEAAAEITRLSAVEKEAVEVIEPFSDKMALIDDDAPGDYTPDWSPFIPVKFYRAAHRFIVERNV